MLPPSGRASPQRSGAQPDEARRAHRERTKKALNRIYPFLIVRQTFVRGEPAPFANVRITSSCNQRCPFCHALPPRPAADPSQEIILSSLERVARLVPGVTIAITGGEPTLRQDLSELIPSILATPGVRELELQTNAVLIGRSPARFQWAVIKGLRALVALHGIDDTIYDACTQTTGQLQSALAGIRHLLSLGTPVELNVVVNALNVAHIDHLVYRVAELFPGPDTPQVHFSIMGMSRHRDVSPLLVEFPQMIGALKGALQAAKRSRARASISLSASHSAVPFCLLDDEMKELCEYPKMYEHEDELDEEGQRRWWHKSDVCTRCVDDLRCLGLPRDYFERFGDAQLEPRSR